MYKKQEGYFTGHRDTKLFFQHWENPQAQGTIIITHGHGEHSACYHRVVDFFKNDRWSFLAWDLRGHGRSEGKRGYAEYFDDYVRDFQIFLKNTLNKTAKKPTVLLAHSMGALTQEKALIENQGLDVSAQVLSAPLVGLALEVPVYKSSGAKFLNAWIPQITLGNEIKNEDLTRDPLIIKEFESDEYRHDKMSPGVYLGMVDSFEFVHSRAGQIKLPTLIQISTQDPVVSTKATERLFSNLGSQKKEILTYEGAKHEMYNDIHREMVFKDLKRFLDEFI